MKKINTTIRNWQLSMHIGLLLLIIAPRAFAQMVPPDAPINLNHQGSKDESIKNDAESSKNLGQSQDSIPINNISKNTINTQSEVKTKKCWECLKFWKSHHQQKSIDDFMPSASCLKCKEGKYLAYDFACKKFYRVKNGNFKDANGLWKLRATYNRASQFRILNVNRYIYDVHFSVDDTNFESEPQPVFNNLFLGIGGGVNDLLNQLAATPDSVKKDKSAAENEDPVGEFEDQLIRFRAEYNRLLEAQLKPYNYCTTMDCACGGENFTDFVDKLTNLRFAYTEAIEAFDKQLAKIDKKSKDANDKIDKCKVETEALEKEIKALESSAKPDPALIEKKKADLAALKCSKKDLAGFKKIIDDAANDKKKVETLKEALVGMWTSFSKLTDEQLMKLVLFANNQVKAHLMYSSPTFYPRGNRLQLGFRISPRDSASSLASRWATMPLEDDSVGLDLPVVLKPFLSFGAGLFTIWGDQIPTNNYGWQSQPDNNGVISTASKYKLTSTTRSYNPIGFVGNATMGMMLNSFIGIGTTIGAGISIDNVPKPAYMGGFSLLLGDRQQFNLSLGWAGVLADELKTDLYPNMSTLLYDAKEDLQYTQNLKTGTYLSLTYTAYKFGNTKTTSSGRSRKK